MLVRKETQKINEKTFVPIISINISSNLTKKNIIDIEVNPEDIADVKALYGVDLEQKLRDFYLEYVFYVEALQEGKSVGDLSLY